MKQTSNIETEKAERLMKALCNHFARKITASYAGNQGQIEFGEGKCIVTASPTALTLQVDAENAENLSRVRQVVVSHLLRFAPEDNLEVTWGDIS